ncbi:glycosyltransferase [Pedobacter punctiformis]|uniref:Glycosyltransferase n=1 Tax=Pedobacter punctiformis TaxID=3004097 RepID=A0ABT4L4S6_9SPHI|nr:glycosyltransferase [Pedobacter sp. HCMS5-2]MCZ4242915.1 glycosyltransferase [Pedobacter sp. HCMS5-2]
MILLDAIYINQSGGKVLLEYFIKNLIFEQKIFNFFFLFDNRLESGIINEIPVNQRVFLGPTEANRLKFYKKTQNDFSKVFCFANVPPPVKKKKSEVYILFHNALILDSKNKDYSYTTRLSFLLKRQYIRYKNQKDYNWIVQTKNMANLLSKGLSLSINSIKVLPFYESGRFTNVNKQLEINNGNFLYVADGVKQKNHLTLLFAWEYLLDKYNLPISLHLTVPPNFISLITEIKRLQNKGVNIINHGRCNFIEIESLYRNCNTFITPSLTESFGLPIIEAAEAGCKILAADLPYTYDIINPLATFDPNKVEDLAEKIRLAFLESHENKTQLIINNKIKDIINLIT